MLYVANGIITRKNKDILLVKRKKDVIDGGLWSFPGGKIENNEQIYEGLVREINEELGFIIDNAKFLKSIEINNTIAAYFICNISNNIQLILNIDELDGFGFFTKEEISQLGKLAFNQHHLLNLF